MAVMLVCAVPDFGELIGLDLGHKMLQLFDFIIDLLFWVSYEK
jgi:hypothetical protein